MKKSMVVPEIVAGLYIILFLYTGIDKLLNVFTLEHQLLNYPLLSKLGGVVAWVLPFIELGIAALLFFPRTKLIGFYCAAALMSVFTLYLAYMQLFDDRRPCTCGGFLKELSWPQHTVFNLVFIILSIIAIRLTQNSIKNNGNQKVVAYT
ncbi:MAG: MauE/DoxX family redox-associated membrane protein [Chitinophagaceae bacterium]